MSKSKGSFLHTSGPSSLSSSLSSSSSQGERKGGVPYSASVRREKSRELAQRRRTTYKAIMDDLNEVLPFPDNILSQLDYNSRLRLTLCFFRMKMLMGMEKEGVKEELDIKEMGGSTSAVSTEVVSYKPYKFYRPGMLQNLMTEALDGFLMVASSNGSMIYLSESIHHHLGIFQSEYTGVSMYDLMIEDDHEEVKSTIAKSEDKISSFPNNRAVSVSFFCRMKCSRFKVANAVTKSPGFKLVYASGSLKTVRSEYFLVMVVRPVSPPSILELRMEANMFITHYNLEMTCLFFDGRLRHLLGYTKRDLEGRTPYELQHHEDLGATLKCSEGIIRCGEGLSGYYRFLTQSGSYVWLQTRAMLMHDSRTGKPTYIMCMNYIINNEKGDKDLVIRQAITAKMDGLQEGSLHNYDPFPLTEREDGAMVNPLQETSWQHKDNLKVEDILVRSASPDVSTNIKNGAKPLEVSSSPLHSNSGIHSTSQDFHSTSQLTSSKSHSGTNFKSLSSVDTSCLPDSTSDLPREISEPTGTVRRLSGEEHARHSLSCLHSTTSDDTSPSSGTSHQPHPHHVPTGGRVLHAKLELSRPSQMPTQQMMSPQYTQEQTHSHSQQPQDNSHSQVHSHTEQHQAHSNSQAGSYSQQPQAHSHHTEQLQAHSNSQAGSYSQQPQAHSHPERHYNQPCYQPHPYSAVHHSAHSAPTHLLHQLLSSDAMQDGGGVASNSGQGMMFGEVSTPIANKDHMMMGGNHMTVDGDHMMSALPITQYTSHHGDNQASLSGGVWSCEAPLLPQLTGEDLEILKYELTRDSAS